MIDEFTTALGELGIRGDVEVQGKLAVITLHPPARESPLRFAQGDTARLAQGDMRRFAQGDMRRRIVALGRAHGFVNVCIEIGRADAALSGD
jgi:hypothetical protein